MLCCLEGRMVSIGWTNDQPSCSCFSVDEPLKRFSRRHLLSSLIHKARPIMQAAQMGERSLFPRLKQLERGSVIAMHTAAQSQA